MLPLLPPPPPPEARKRIRNNSAGGGGGGGAEGWGVSLELISTIMQIRSRGLWDLGNKDDGVCYGCNWKMVKSDRFCTRTRLLLSLGLHFPWLADVRHFFHLVSFTLSCFSELTRALVKSNLL